MGVRVKVCVCSRGEREREHEHVMERDFVGERESKRSRTSVWVY